MKRQLDKSQPCKKFGCLSVRDHNSRISQKPLQQFSQNLVLHMFRAPEDDLDRSQPYKKSGCLPVILSLNTTYVNLQNRSNDFRKTWNYIYFGHEKTI